MTPDHLPNTITKSPEKPKRPKRQTQVNWKLTEEHEIKLTLQEEEEEEEEKQRI